MKALISKGLAAGVVAAVALGLSAPVEARDRPVALERRAHMILAQYPDPANPQRRRQREEPGGYQPAFAPLEAIIANLRASVPGRFVGVQGPFGRGGRSFYRITWETPDGRLIIFTVDAHTGQIIGR
jgi:hypothetical protein